MSRLAHAVRLALLAAVTSVPLHAQNQVWAGVSLYDGATRIEYRDQVSDLASTHAVFSGSLGTAQAWAESDLVAGTLRSEASTPENRYRSLAQYATAQAGMAVRMTIFANCPPSGCAPQPLELYFHSVLSGTVDPEWGREGGAGATLQVTLWGTSAGGVRTRMKDTSLTSPTPSQPNGGPVRLETYAQSHIMLPLVNGANTFDVVLALIAGSYNGFVADASHTGRVYLPTVDGYTYDVEGDALADQARPTWAVVATPEPATLSLALLGVAGLGALGAIRRRRA